MIQGWLDRCAIIALRIEGMFTGLKTAIVWSSGTDGRECLV